MASRRVVSSRFRRPLPAWILSRGVGPELKPMLCTWDSIVPKERAAIQATVDRGLLISRLRDLERRPEERPELVQGQVAAAAAVWGLRRLRGRRLRPGRWLRRLLSCGRAAVRPCCRAAGQPCGREAVHPTAEARHSLQQNAATIRAGTVSLVANPQFSIQGSVIGAQFCLRRKSVLRFRPPSIVGF